MRKILFIFTFIAFGTCSFAINPNALSDSLNVYAKSKANVGKISVTRLRQSGKSVRVYTNEALGCISLSKSELTHLKRQISIWTLGNTNGDIHVYSKDVELDKLITSRYIPRPEKDRFHIRDIQPLVKNISNPYEIKQGLNGKHIALWGSHGLYYNQELEMWKWQRARVWTTVEDLYTSSYTGPFLVPMLENAGAVVLQPREYMRPGYTTIYIRWQKGSGTENITVRHGDIETHYSVNTAIGADVWQYLCTIDRNDGMPKVTSQIPIDVYIGGQNGSVARFPMPNGIENMKSSIAPNIMEHAEAVDTALIAERLKLAQTSNYPRWMEGARYWLEFAGIPDSVWNFTENRNDYTDDYACRGRWVNYLCGGSEAYPEGPGLGIPVNACMAFHSDAGTTMDESIVGTLAIYTNFDNDKKYTFPAGGTRELNRDLADKIQTQIVEDIRNTMVPDWPRRKLWNSSYAESRNPKVPSMLLELLSHQNYGDMRYALDPKFKFIVSRAIYKAIGRFIAEQNGNKFTVQPLPVQSCRILYKNDNIATLSWLPTDDLHEASAQPTYYVVYTRENNEGWDNGTQYKNSQLSFSEDGRYNVEIPIDRDKKYDFRIVAGNDGGVSLPSEVVSMFISSKNTEGKCMLLVNAFNEIRGPEMMAWDSITGGVIPGSRPIPYLYETSYIGEQCNYNRKDPWHTDDDCGFGMCHMDKQGQILVGNTLDYPSRHGDYFASQGISYISSNISALPVLDSTIVGIDLIIGKTHNDVLNTQKNGLTGGCVSPDAEEAFAYYMQNGGKIIVSGAYVGYPHYASKSGVFHILTEAQQRNFATEMNESTLSAENVSALSKIHPEDKVVARYNDTGLPACIENGKYIIWGFPLDCLNEGNLTHCLELSINKLGIYK